MSKFLNVTNGDYTITVDDDGIINLNAASVVINGDLDIRGTQTDISTTVLVVEDNIIELNKVDTGDPEDISGISINRAQGIPSALWVFDEFIKYESPQNLPEDQEFGIGGWAPRDVNNLYLALELTSITTPGTDLNLLGIYNGPGDTDLPNPGKLTVKGTEAYENRVTEPSDIPNKKYVDDSILAFLSSEFQDTIREGTFAGAETEVEVQDTTVTGNPSQIRLSVGGALVATYFEDSVNLYDIKIDGNEISATQPNEDLVLTANGIGAVRVEDGLNLTTTPHNGTGVIDPAEPDSGTLLYSKERGLGGTGVHFVNEDETRDEIISANRALVYSMIF